MKTIKLSISDFCRFPKSSKNYVICDKWGVCVKQIFCTLEEAEAFYDKFKMSLPHQYIVLVDWYN